MRPAPRFSAVNKAIDATSTISGCPFWRAVRASNDSIAEFAVLEFQRMIGQSLSLCKQRAGTRVKGIDALLAGLACASISQG